MFRLVTLGIFMAPILSLGQIAQSFNSGGLNATTADLRISSSFGEIFVNHYQAGDTRIQEGIFSNGLIITSLHQDLTVPKVKVYPTQFKNEFFIESENKGRFIIFNVSGQTVMEGCISELKTTVHLQSSAEWHILKIYLEKNNETVVFKIQRSE